jgi:aubergine-like protein
VGVAYRCAQYKLLEPRPLSAALRAWNTCNEYMPSRIIVYRDGVGDGQLKTLVNYEVPQFLDCLKSVGRGYK